MTSAPPAFEPVNRVEQQLVAAAHGDRQAQKAFERFVLDETLYVATPDGPTEESRGVLDADTTVTLLNTSLDDGRTAAAVFTSPQRIHEAFGAVGYLGLTGRQLFEIIRNGPAVLNPGQSYGVVWEPESLSAMLGLTAERVITHETQIVLGYPADPPPELVERLREALSAIPGTQRAWLALASWPEDQSQSWYLDVRTTNPDREPLQRALAAAATATDLGGLPIDMAVNPEGAGDGMGVVVL